MTCLQQQKHVTCYTTCVK